MSERALRLASAVLAIAGAAVAGYLLYVRHTGSALACATGGCETVQSSPYSELFGVPVAAFGLVGYATMLAAAVARRELARLAHVTVALSAVVFGAYLLYVQVHVIDAVCDWCLVSDGVTTAIAALALLRMRAAALGPALGARA